MQDPELTDDPEPYPKPAPAIVTDGVLLSDSGVSRLGLISLDGPVMLADREGVYAHSFKCRECRLEWVLFSWRSGRHRVGRVLCPECGLRTQMIHYRATLSTSVEMILDDRQQGNSLEIFNCFPFGDADLMNDSSIPN
jgi:transcription elongation factor Elf1